MKKLSLFLILPLLIFVTSCTMVIKSISKKVANDFDDHTDLNVSGLMLTGKDGKTESFGTLFNGKTVYMYVWKLGPLTPPADADSAYVRLKKRFNKYNDVVFINLYNGDKTEDWNTLQSVQNKNVKSYRLTADAVNQEFKDLMGPTTSPQIVGSDGKILSFKGPKPTDKLVVDYVLYQARSGQDGTISSKQLIKGINSKLHFKDKRLTTWYTDFYGKKPEGKLSATISSSGSQVGL
jgi:hypothetical protein